ncbi:MAG: hypothetical protein ACUVXA_06760 [Candidatus Jordarchaeum sp.]|uniref:hypothetical protein n=1 Tax=Candidatus Jordarchaeum sp. TaxID=2823881 RepID=UPI004049232C
MPVFGKDKKESYLDSPIKGKLGKTSSSKKDSDILNDVKLGIERLSEILSTYLSSFEERLGTIEKKIGSLDGRIANLEKRGRMGVGSTGKIVVPSELVEDATRTRPIIIKEAQEPEIPTVETEPVASELPRPIIPPPIKPIITIPKTVSEVETPVAEPPTEIKTEEFESKISLSKEVPVAENFFDELRARLDKKSSQLPEENLYQPTPEKVAVAGTKTAPKVATSEEGVKTEDDIRLVLQRLKDSISKRE